MKNNLHSECKENRETASETLEDADGVDGTTLLDLVQCGHAKSLRIQSSKTSISYYILFCIASFSRLNAL